MTRVAAAVAVLALALGACGGAGETSDDGIGDDPGLERVDLALAPGRIEPDLTLHRNQDDETVAAFANAGERTVMADGSIWEIRRADRLIGTLQITTVLPDVDLGRLQTRLTIVNQILSSTPSSIDVDGVEVFAVELEDRASFVWFGDGLFEVVQIRDRQVESFESVVASIIAHQQTEAAWVPLVEEETDLD